MRRASRRGSLSIFFCLIMAAIMLVFGTLLQAAALRSAENDLSRAMSAQIRTSLASYDLECRQFGLFGYSAEAIDLSVFRETLPTKMQSTDLTTDMQLPLTQPAVLQNQIIRYMKGRVPAVYLDLLISRLSGFKTSMSNSGSSSSLSDIIDQVTGGASANDISTAADSIFGDLLDQLKQDVLNEIEKNYRQYATELLGVDSDTDILSMIGKSPDFLNPASISEFVGNLDTILGFDTAPIYDQLCLDEYIVGQFRPAVEKMITSSGTVDMMTMDGRLFKDLKETRKCEVEQILTGISQPENAELAVKLILISLRTIVHLIWILSDQQQMSVLQSTATIISAAIVAVSVGTVVIDPQIITYILAAGKAIGGGINDVNNLMAGKMVNIWPGKSEINLGFYYLDYLRIFLLFIPQSTLVERIGLKLDNILPRKCYTRMQVRIYFRGRSYTMTGGYIE